jgi:hypothetical protein
MLTDQVTIEIETTPPKNLKDTPSVSGTASGTSTPTLVAEDDAK